MIQLYYFPGNASFAVHSLLNELGTPFELRRVRRDEGEHKSPAYLKLNPNGLIPLYVDGDLVLYETAAILLHLADTHPAAQLAPALGTAARAQLYKWLFWLSNSVQPTMFNYFYPGRLVAAGNDEGAAQVKAQMEAKASGLLDQLEAEFARHGGPWLLGEAFTAADPLCFLACRWTRGMAHPARNRPALAAYLARMAARPAIQQTFATEELSAPLY